MGRGEYLFTSESVSEGHPDKVCDRISDAVVDAYLALDSNARVACETLVTTNRMVLAGEVRGPESITSEALESIARTCVREIGYEQEGFHWAKAAVRDATCSSRNRPTSRSGRRPASDKKEEGAGDQGIMFGYASRRDRCN